MRRTVGSELNRTAGLRPAPLASGRTSSRHDRSVSALQTWKHEDTRNSRASGGYESAVRGDSSEASTNGHVLTDTNHRSAIFTIMRVERAAGPQLQPVASVCLPEQILQTPGPNATTLFRSPPSKRPQPGICKTLGLARSHPTNSIQCP